ncbi:hypothetical protein [Streptosporangium roseum]|uniref:hypothetical protein n=1 Tax=Streptosporangium roseum TaxID=2001 RepID=UPI0004CD2518|nr:hypothetical protein [Streptosporangium roseum]
MPSTEPYAVAGIRTMPEHMVSPGYLSFLNWLDEQDLPAQGHDYDWRSAPTLPPGERVHATYATITVWADPLRGAVAVYDLDEDGNRIPATGGGYQTHDEDVTLITLPAGSGVITGDPEYQP